MSALILRLLGDCFFLSFLFTDSSEGRLEKTSREGNIHASASTVQNANQLNFSDDSDYEYFDDSEADRDYNPLVDKESSSEDECQEDIKHYVVVPQTP